MSTACNCNANCVTNCCPVVPDIAVTEVTVSIAGDAVAFYEELFSVSGGTVTSGGTVVTLAHSPAIANSVQVYQNGLLLRDTVDYNTVDDTITLVTAVGNDDVIQVRYIGLV